MEKKKLTKLYRKLTKKRRELFKRIRKEEVEIGLWFNKELEKLRKTNDGGSQ